MGIVVNPLRRRSASRAAFAALGQMEGWVEQAPDDVVLAGTAAEILAARASGRVALFGGLEGAHGLGGDLDPLADMRARGLRYVGLSHFSLNRAATPAFGWGANAHSGLTDYGRDLVDELNRLGILVDLAHINRAGFLEAAARSRAPVVVSHTGVSGGHDSWRNIDDEQLRAVADTGGVVCVIFAPYYTDGKLFGDSTGIVRHLLHVIDVVGEDHVGLGSDLDGFVFPPTDMPDISYMPVLTQRLLEAGLSEQRIRKCLGGNILRVFGEVCG